MNSRHFFEGIITKENNSLPAHLIRGILTPLSWIYELVHIIYFIPYKLKIRKKYRAYIPVISVGNITMGGTGKTPFVATLTNIIKDMGLKPVIISRGYGRKSKTPYILMPGTQVSTDITGDEPQTLSKALNIPIIIGKNRCVSVELSKELNPDIIILDDGMQYWQLEKDIEIVVANAHKPLGSGTTLPAGDLRENKNALKRAQFIILNNSINLNKKEQEAAIAKTKSVAPDSNVFIGTIKPTSISFNNNKFDVSMLENKNITAFSGIANPNRFTETLKQIKVNILEFIEFIDHHNYTTTDIENITKKAKENHSDYIITTTKDIVKISNCPENLGVLNITMEIEEDNFKKQLSTHISHLLKK